MENSQAHAGNQPYDENFYRAQKDGPLISAVEVLSYVAEFIRPHTVIDVGCGTGSWLAVWQKKFGTEIFGIDGDYVDRSQLFIDEKFFHPANLEDRINLNRRFDLAMTLEVAEHLSPARADSFVEDLTRLSDVILFSAAIPAQGGINHVNEQWQSYWAQKFLRHDYVGLDYIRPKIWTNPSVKWWYCQNTLLYIKSAEFYRYPELEEFYFRHRNVTVYDKVHPECYANSVVSFQNFVRQVNAYLNRQG